MRLALITLLPFLGAVLPPLMIRAGRDTCALVTGGVTLASLALLLAQAPAVWRGEVLVARLPWVPQLGLELAFFVDGYGLLFAFLILAIGPLIVLYARFYLDRGDPMGRFYAYLLLFQGAMLGIVLAENVLLLLVFWELTSLASFLLIGHWRHLPEARQGARMALVVTGAGGFALIAGLLLLGEAAGSYRLTEILARGERVLASPLYVPALLLVLGGAFTKSAQFPFHFWLPHAMAAPTPVSAYLHSATMVKAGVFLLGRFWPVLSGGELWFYLVTGTGLVTMLVGAWIALFKDDLKALLAFSTVSHLGLITMLFGMATPLAAAAALLHLLNHATFKAALFLTAGIVEHEAGTRDARRLGGLLRAMPVTGTLATVAAAAMAGVPPLNGFLSKEMMLEAAAGTDYAGLPWLVAALATLGAAGSVAYAARFVVHVFLGAPRDDRPRGESPRRPHDPPPGLWLPVAALVVPVVATGAFPALVQPVLDRAAGAAVGGALPAIHLALWSGLKPALFMSGAAFAGGFLLLAAFRPVSAWRARLPRPEAKALFDAGVAAAVTAARALVAAVDDGSLRRALGAVVLAALAVGLWAFLGGSHGAGTRPTLPVNPPALALWLVTVATCAGVVAWHRRRLTALVLTGAVGLAVSILFVQFSAPDLALTQLSVEVVTVILMLLALNYLPRASERDPSPWRRGRDLALAAAAGLGVALPLYAVLTRDLAQTIASWQLAQSKPGGGGANVVNVILVDFRGYDTFGEIIVLGIAALAIFALLDGAVGGASGQRLAGLPTRREAGDRHPLLLVVATRVLLPLALAAGLFILLRGHNQPGGGFVAGLVVGIALILQYMASGFAWAERRTRVDYHALIGLGVLVAGAAGVGAWFAGLPFLTSGYDYFRLPLVGEIGLATAMAFDVGVFLTVLGVVMLTLANLARVGRKAEPRPEPERPMDIVLPDAPARRREA